MKNHRIFIFKIFNFVLLTISVLACQKTPINGNLDGEWEVMEVSPAPVTGNSSTRVFYSFSHHVCQLSFFGAPFTNGNLVYTGDSMTLDFPFAQSPEDNLILQQYGIFSNPVSFDVYFESKTRMILTNDVSTVVLRKF